VLNSREQPPYVKKAGRAGMPPGPIIVNVHNHYAFDRSSLANAIVAIHASGKSEAEVRKDVIALFRNALAEGHRLAREGLEARRGARLGLACARYLSHVEDELIRAIHNYVVTYVHPVPDREIEAKLVIAAVGGYGRGTLAPGSDIDLLFLLPADEFKWGERVVEAVLYVLWDLRQKVGYSTRSIEDCLALAREDMTIRTALFESRMILGDDVLFENMRARFEREIVNDTPAEFVAAKLAERDGRLTQGGRTRYLVEPNVKEGKGGLRDLNTLFWIAKYVYRVHSISELVTAGLFSTKEYHLFRRCEEFLWRVRCHMHFVTNRAEDRLSFDLQPILAERLGYSSRAGLASVERFMKHYFLVTRDVGNLTTILCAALEERQAKPEAVIDRFGGQRSKQRKKHVIGQDFMIENGRVTVARDDVFERDPVNLIRLFWIADRNSVAIHPDATRLVTLSLKRIDSTLRGDAEANKLFLDILISHNATEVVLRLMNEAGVLGRFIPEFGRVVALMQFNMYHHYTVDEHLLRAVGFLADLESHRKAEDHPLASEVLASLTDRRIVYLALFLHDVAKGRPEDHSVAGMAVARKLCPRLGFDPAETEAVAWLVENHLLMSDTAQRRDLADHRTIETFAACVQTLERLKMLFILTICDIRAVGPGVWNAWKGELLRTLYWETEVVLTGGHSAVNRERRVAIAKNDLRQALPNWSDLDFEAYAVRHQQPYWLKVDLAHKIHHAKLLNMTEVEMPAPITDIATNAARGVTELNVIAPDHPRLLSIIAGACAASGANIVDAQVFTTADGLALDTIFISRAFDFDEDELRRANKITLAIERALLGEVRLQDMIANRRDYHHGRGKTFQVQPRVTIDNTLSKQFTVVEVSGLDRPGLLFDLTTILSKLDLNIGSAHIVTFGEKAVDVFYITDFNGAKITSASQKAAIRRRIFEKFQPPAEAAAKVA
jgi:[protein-PII] uridylyltransferase